MRGPAEIIVASTPSCAARAAALAADLPPLVGEGAGKIPALAKNGALEAAGYPIMVVTGGKNAMPWFRGALTDQQISDVINYVRSNFGNKYKDKVTPAMVAEMGVPAPKGGMREQ